MPDSTNKTANSGVGVVGVIQIVFIILKLAKVLSWPWWKVMLPLICSVGITSICALTTCIITAIYLSGLNKSQETSKVPDEFIDYNQLPPSSQSTITMPNESITTDDASHVEYIPASITTPPGPLYDEPLV